MLVHVVNHGTQHRSEAAAILTAEGHSPGELDLFNYAEEQAAAGRNGRLTPSSSQGPIGPEGFDLRSKMEIRPTPAMDPSVHGRSSIEVGGAP